MNTHSMNTPSFKPFDFFPAVNETEKKMRDWKLAEANRNNRELLERVSREANKARFAQ